MRFLAAVLGFGVAIVASVLIYAFAFDATISAIEWMLGLGQGSLSVNMKLIVVFVLLFVFVSIGTRLGRFARDWIEAGRRYDRPAAR